MMIWKEQLNLVRPEVIKTNKNTGSNCRPHLHTVGHWERKGKKKKKQVRGLSVPVTINQGH